MDLKYGLWTRPELWWIESWMAVLLTYLLTSSYLYIGKIPENFLRSIFPEKLQP